MREAQANAIHLKDYTPPAFSVETVELDVDIREDHALVKAKLAVRRNAPGPLVLDGDELELISLSIDQKSVPYQLTPEQFNAMVKSEVARWAKILKEAGIKPE